MNAVRDRETTYVARVKRRSTDEDGRPVRTWTIKSGTGVVGTAYEMHSRTETWVYADLIGGHDISDETIDAIIKHMNLVYGI
jgi:hypothetical protein